MGYYKLLKDNKIVGISELPVISEELNTREITKEEFDLLFQNQEREFEQKQLEQQKKFELTNRLNQLSQDFIQAMAGAEFEDLEKRQLEFQSLHNKLRVLEGKEPRNYIIKQ